MRSKKILICDKDEAYVDALTHFLIKSCPNYEIASYTEEDIFGKEQEKFDVSLLGVEFLEALSQKAENQEEVFYKHQLGEILYLCDARAEDYEPYEKLYKFQAMDAFLGRLMKKSSKQEASDELKEIENQHITAVLSPIHHELELPFSLMVSQWLSEERKVLFVDLEPMSILPQLIQQEETKDLLDFLYQLESQKQELLQKDISSEQKKQMQQQLFLEYIFYYQGISYLAPSQNALDFSDVTKEQWLYLWKVIAQSSYEEIVVLYDGFMPGCEKLWMESSEMILLGREGDYYQKSMYQYQKLLEQMKMQSQIDQISLPMSAAALMDGTYQMEELYLGNLGRFVEDYMIRRQKVARAGG